MWLDFIETIAPQEAEYSISGVDTEPVMAKMFGDLIIGEVVYQEVESFNYSNSSASSFFDALFHL